MFQSKQREEVLSLWKPITPIQITLELILILSPNHQINKGARLNSSNQWMMIQSQLLQANIKLMNHFISNFKTTVILNLKMELTQKDRMNFNVFEFNKFCFTISMSFIDNCDAIPISQVADHLRISVHHHYVSNGVISSSFNKLSWVPHFHLVLTQWLRYFLNFKISLKYPHATSKTHMWQWALSTGNLALLIPIQAKFQ